MGNNLNTEKLVSAPASDEPNIIKDSPKEKCSKEESLARCEKQHLLLQLCYHEKGSLIFSTCTVS